MSSLVYGIVTAKRVAAPAGQSQDTVAPAMGIYIDALAALVPAEALALYVGIVIPNATHTTSVNGKNVTVISNPSLLEWSCAGLLALSSLLYFVGRKKGQLRPWDVLRFFIPPMAFAAWLLVQNPGVWDIWWPGSSIGARAVIAALVAIVLGIAASALGQQADAMPGVLAVTGVNPYTGPVAGGTNVTVSGSGFTGATVVQFGQVRAPDLAFVDDTQLTVTSPQAAAAGRVDVTVTTPAGTSSTSPADHFTYEAAAAAPTVTGVFPERGPVAGGTNVTVSGSGFTGATVVQFGQVRAQNLTVASDTQLTVTSPLAGAAGRVDVTVTTPAGTSSTSPADHFTYEAAAAAPTVTGVFPEIGPLTGGTNVTVSGSGFTGATVVQFGQARGQNLTVASDTQLTVTSPPFPGDTLMGRVDVTVTTPPGTSSRSPADLFTYEEAVAVPIVTGVFPEIGPVAGGTNVTVHGSGFTGATVVQFGQVRGQNLTVTSDIQLTVTSPQAAAAGRVDVTVTTPAGTSSISQADWFVYDLFPLRVIFTWPPSGAG